MKHIDGLHRYRSYFPAAENLLYLDAAHQTPLALPVRSRMDTFLSESLNFAGPKSGWLEAVERVREQVASFFGVEPDEIAFTKNTSEGLNICANGVDWRAGDNVLVLEDEHPNSTYAWLAQRELGVEVRFVPRKYGWADANTFEPYLDHRTRAIAVSHVMFHDGSRNDIESIAALGQARGIEVVIDAMQSVGVLPLDFKSLGQAHVVSGSHKGLLTPHGLGFLYTPRGASALSPTYVATASVANSRSDLIAGEEPVQLWETAHRFEIGNFNLLAIHALGAALTLLKEPAMQGLTSHLMSLGDALISGMDELGVELIGPREADHRAPHIYVFGLKDPEWQRFFESRNVRISPVRDGVRVSFGLYNSVDDVARFVGAVAEGLPRIRALRSA